MFIDLHWRQVAYFALSQVEPDAVSGVFDGAYWDGDPLLAPEMAFVEEHMGHAMVAGVDDQPLDPPDGPVGGKHVLAPAHLHLTQGDSLIGDHYWAVAVSRHP
jgi:hypothetical protein